MDSLELIAVPAARRLAEADVEGAAHVADSISAALGPTLAMEAPLQLRQALADLLVDEDDAVDERNVTSVSKDEQVPHDRPGQRAMICCPVFRDLGSRVVRGTSPMGLAHPPPEWPR